MTGCCIVSRVDDSGDWRESLLQFIVQFLDTCQLWGRILSISYADWAQDVHPECGLPGCVSFGTTASVTRKEHKDWKGEEKNDQTDQGMGCLH